MTTISLPLARQISEKAKEKGIKLLGSAHCWYQYNETQWEITNLPFYADVPRMDNQYPAYTCDELFSILPFSINLGSQDDYYLMFERFEHSYSCTYASQDLTMYDKNGLAINFEADTPAECLGQLLLWTMKEGYIKGELK